MIGDATIRRWARTLWNGNFEEASLSDARWYLDLRELSEADYTRLRVALEDISAGCGVNR